MLSSLFVLILSALAAVNGVPLDVEQARSWPDPEPCSGNCTGIHDPSLIQAQDGNWWLFSTNGNISIATAPEITGPWQYQGPMLPNGSSIHILKGQQYWAPDVSYISGTYYAYYAVSLSGSRISDIGVATTRNIAGKWTDHGSIGIPKARKYNKIDPNLFRHPHDDTNYFNFGSWLDGIFQTTVDDTFLSAASGAKPQNTVYNSTFPTGGDQPAIVEGSFEFAYKVGATTFYYMFFSSGACCNPANALAAPGDEYKVMVCRAEVPTGPFFDKHGKNCATQNGGSLVLGSHGSNVYAPGGQGVLQNPTLKAPVLYYHYVNPHIGYDFDQFQFGFNYLDFSSGWPVVTK